MSEFVWLDYSEHERRKMLDIVDLFREHETRDELGIGSVRDTFADLFFPGTSTIMTRARYFLLVPWMYERLEKQRISSAQISDRARRAETDLIEAIERSDDRDGNIGKIARTALKRLPSSVYWQGLAIWGIRDFKGAQSQYHRSLDRYYVQLNRHGGRASERDIEHDDLNAPNWHPGLISPPAGFPSDCSLRLNRREAEYLSERIRLSPTSSGSLLAVLLDQDKLGTEVPFVWQNPIVGKLSANLSEALSHAQRFSEIMHGSALLYNLMLSEQANREDSLVSFNKQFTNWAHFLTQHSRTFANWKRKTFWEIVWQVNPRISRATKEFIDSWCDLALTGNPVALSDNQAARKLIRDRESKLKRSLARIDNPRALELWRGDSGSAQLEFRWLISQRLLRDIFQGLESTNA